MYEIIGNFFFNLKFWHEFEDILLHSYGFLIVDFQNVKSYAIGSGRLAASLTATKLQSQVTFFEESFFVS